MKIVKMKGGLGNQMFQYAFAKELQKYSGDIVKLDFSAYNSLVDNIRKPRILKFELNVQTADDFEISRLCKLKHDGNSLGTVYKIKVLLEDIINSRYYLEKNRSYKKVDEICDFEYFDGYWQSWQHVDAVFETLRKDFVPNYSVTEKTEKILRQVREENSVFVGIRKGDYEAEQHHYGSFGQEYYDKAMNYIKDRISNPIYYIFSNNIAWVKNNLNFGDRKVIYREDSDVIDDFEELLIMMECKHSIIINSTYHWWGARMNDTEEKIVVAPQKWFFDEKPIDIVPPNWIRI